LAAALAFALSPLALAGPGAFKAEPFTGKVVPLADVLAKDGVKLDPDAAPAWLALEGDDGKTYPLVKDDGSRMFFKDAALLGRPVQLTGRLVPRAHLLQVVQVHSLVKGRPHELFYWCDVCSIRRSEKMICECCGGPMYLREEPTEK
jgi:hypothetical protein